MAEIAPFRGILYTPRAGDPSSLLAPPYDVIDEPERARLEARSPHNCVRLILPRAPAGRPDGDKYAAAAALARAWLDEGALARDAAPAVYRYHQRYTVSVPADGSTGPAAPTVIIRKGFIARVRLHRFDEGVIRPHERTLSGPKIDRLHLMRALRAHEFSQVFGLYPDPARESDRLFVAVESQEPFLHATTADGVEHSLWRLVDPAALEALARFMAPRSVYIADGHHRYETMLALRDELRGEGDRESFELGSMFFCNMDDPGLLVFPTHRALVGVAGFDRGRLLEAARRFFVVEEEPMPTGEAQAAGAAIQRGLSSRAHLGVTFAVATPGADRIAYLRLRDDLAPDAIPELPRESALRTLDVTVLHAVVFEALLGLTREAQAAQTNLRYAKSWERALDELRAPDVQAVFFMNPTKVSQVQAVADAGCVMPQKSTFFHPKIASGLVMNPVDD